MEPERERTLPPFSSLEATVLGVAAPPLLSAVAPGGLWVAPFWPPFACGCSALMGAVMAGAGGLSGVLDALTASTGG